MPVSRWPEEDWIAWNRAFDADDLLDGCNRATRMAPRTRITTETGYARWLIWLGTEHPACLNDPAGQRATRERVRDYLLSYACRLRAPSESWRRRPTGHGSPRSSTTSTAASGVSPPIQTVHRGQSSIRYGIEPMERAVSDPDISPARSSGSTDAARSPD